MKVYKNFLKVVLTRKITLIIYFVVFVAISFSLSVNTKNSTPNFKESKLNLYIFDKDNSELSKALIAYLKTKNNVFEENAKNESEEEIYKKIKREISLGQIDSGLVINKGLEQNLQTRSEYITTINDSRSQYSIYSDIEITKFLLFAEQVKKALGTFDFERIQNALNEKITVNKIAKQGNKSVITSFKYFFNLFGFFSFSMIINVVGFTILLLKKPIIKIRNDVSPISTLRFSIENFLAELTVVFLFSFFVIGLNIIFKIKHLEGVPLFSYILNCCAYVATILSMTFLLINLLKKDSVYGILGTVLPLALAFISGMFVPLEYVSPVVLKIARFFPTYYFVQANEFAFTFLKTDWRNIGIEVLFLLLYLALGIYVATKKRTQNAIESEEK